MLTYHTRTLRHVLLISYSKAEANIDDKYGKRDKGWGLAFTILSLIATSFIIYIHHFSPSLKSIIIDQKPEGIIIFVLLAFSTALVGIVSGPDRGLAVDKNGAVFVGNMYYSSWLGFINIIFVFSSYIEGMFGFNVRRSMEARSSSFTYWTALLISSIIVMGTSADIYNRNCDVDDRPQPFCSRSIFAVFVGVLGVVVSLAIVVMKISLGGAPFLLEVGLGIVLFLFYIFEVAFVTDIEGPGSPLGNLYYFSWISFLLTFMVGKTCHEDYVEAQIIVEQQQRERPVPTLSDVSEDDGQPRELRSKANADEDDIEI